MTPDEILAWIEASKASVYYHPTLKLWIAADQHTSRLGETLQEAVESLAKGVWSGLEKEKAPASFLYRHLKGTSF